MPVKKKTVRNTPKLPKNVKINQKRKSQKKRGRRASRRQRGGDDISNVEFNNEYIKPFKEIEAFYNEYKRLYDEPIGRIASNYIRETTNQGYNEPYNLTHPFFKKLEKITHIENPSYYLRACNSCFKNPSIYNLNNKDKVSIKNLISFVIDILGDQFGDSDSVMNSFMNNIEKCFKNREDPKKKCNSVFPLFSHQIDNVLSTISRRYASTIHPNPDKAITARFETYREKLREKIRKKYVNIFFT